MTNETHGNWESLSEADEWDADFAEQLHGSTLLVGLTYLKPDGTFVSREQIFGRVEILNEEQGIGLRRDDTQELVMIAPMLDAVDYAEPGICHLKDAGREIENPDFVASFTVTMPALA